MRLNSVFGGRMDRREFGRLVAGAALAPAWVSASAQGVGVKGIRFSFMLWALEKQASFDRCVEIVAEAGYQGIELPGEFQSWSPEQRARIMTRMRSLGMVFDAMSGVKAGFAVPDQMELFRAQFTEHLRAAQGLLQQAASGLSGKALKHVRSAEKDLSVALSVK